MAEQARSHSVDIFDNFQEEVKKAAAEAPPKKDVTRQQRTRARDVVPISGEKGISNLHNAKVVTTRS
jgi:hypothetical protein